MFTVRNAPKTYCQRKRDGITIISDCESKLETCFEIIKEVESKLGCKIKPKGFDKILFVNIQNSRTLVGEYKRFSGRIKIDLNRYRSKNDAVQTLFHELVHVVDLNTNRSVSELFYPMYKKKLKQISEITQNKNWLTPIEATEDFEVRSYSTGTVKSLSYWRAELPTKLSWQSISPTTCNKLQVSRNYSMKAVDELAACSFEEYMTNGKCQDIMLDGLSEILKNKMFNYFNS